MLQKFIINLIYFSTHSCIVFFFKFVNLPPPPQSRFLSVLEKLKRPFAVFCPNSILNRTMIREFYGKVVSQTIFVLEQMTIVITQRSEKVPAVDDAKTSMSCALRRTITIYTEQNA